MRSRLFSILLLLCISVPATRLAAKDTLRVTACSDAIFRIRISPSGEFPESLMERYGILKTDWTDPQTSVKQDGTSWTISTATHSLRVDHKSQTLTLMDAWGKVLVGGISFHGGGTPLCRELRDSRR